MNAESPPPSYGRPAPPETLRESLASASLSARKPPSSDLNCAMHGLLAATLANQALSDVERVGSLSARSEPQRAVPVLHRWDRRDDVRAVVARLSAATV